jgi:predicted secreted Zn-dependent protease
MANEANGRRPACPGSTVVGLRFIVPVLVSGSLAGIAQARDSFRIEYFDVHGSTARELRADLSRVGPVGETGIRGDGYTEYRIAWRFTMTSKDGVCRAHDVEVDLDVRMMLPRWKQPAAASAALVRTWNRFSEVLREHEDGHHRIAVAAAREVRRKLRGAPKSADCRALEARMNASANEVLREYRQRQADFDRKTDYGRVQSAGIL